MINIFTANTVSELICFLFAIICLAQDKNLVWRSQVIYLFVTCLAEISGIFVSKHTHNNQWVYNIFILFEAGFSYLMFANLIANYTKWKPVIIVGIILFSACYLYSIVINGFLTYAAIAYLVMSVQFVLLSLYYYYLLLRDNQYVNLKRSPEFWWIAGTLFFYFGNTACNIFDDKLYALMIDTFHQHLTYFVFKALNIILYGCWSYSFICKKWLIQISKA